MISEVFNMDCVEYMRTLPDNYFDIAICDPPYGDAESGNFHLGGGRFGGRFDRYKQPTAIPRRRQMESLQEATNYPPPNHSNKPTGIHTQGGTWATKYRRPSITPTEADSADIRGGGGKQKASCNALTGMLPHRRSSSMSFFE